MFKPNRAFASAFLVATMFMVAQAYGMSPDNQYPSYLQIKSDLNELAGSSIGSVSEEGATHEGRKIVALRIAAAGDHKPKVLLVGGHHGREQLGITTTRLIAKYLVEQYDTDNYVKFLLDSSEVWVVPLLNPDKHPVRSLL